MSQPVEKKPKVAFLCVHNSCRSQIAEALGKLLASDVFESYSAGTETKPRINPDATRIMKETFGVDMEATQRSKLWTEIPPVDVVITMGCDVQCPFLQCERREDWGLPDPTGRPDAAFVEIIREIERRIGVLKRNFRRKTAANNVETKSRRTSRKPSFFFAENLVK